MPHDTHGNPTRDEAYQAKVREIQAWLMHPYRDPGTATQSVLRERFWSLVRDWEGISQELTEQFGTTLEDGADWQDFEADQAMNASRFWWVWGN